ncbi:MAG: 7TM diverse intracellular signaling domain-containing protein [Myxococcota bacterium]|nr:7TM diverse intracellular signaling domain-containing protein [Myxococcota bacterium]
MLLDPESSLTIEDVLTPHWEQRFEEIKGIPIIHGFSDRAYWLKMEVENRQKIPRNWYLQFTNSIIDYVTLFTRNPRGGYSAQRSGDLIPFSQRPMRMGKITFPIDLPVQCRTVAYIRIETKGSMQFEFNVFSNEALLETERDRQLLYGIFFGIVAGIFLYTLFYFLPVRETINLYFAAYVAASFMFLFSHYSLSGEYFWPEYPAWTNLADHVFASLMCFTGMLYPKKLLQLDRYMPIMARVFNITMGASLVVMIWPFFLPYWTGEKLLSLLGFVSAPAVLYASGYLWFVKNLSSARYLLTAWTVLLLGLIIFLLTVNGYLPHNLFTDYCIQIGLMLQVILLSLAQADRLSTLKNEIAELLEERSKELHQVSEELSQKYTKSRLDDETLERFAAKLIAHMDEEKPYRDGNITLSSISKTLSVPSNYLSQVLNIKLHKNFYSFINEYRLNEFKRRLQNPENSSKGILDIAYDSGFNSKSSFNVTFKKYENTTPSEYRRRITAKKST